MFRLKENQNEHELYSYEFMKKRWCWKTSLMYSVIENIISVKNDILLLQQQDQKNIYKRNMISTWTI